MWQRREARHCCTGKFCCSKLAGRSGAPSIHCKVCLCASCYGIELDERYLSSRTTTSRRSDRKRTAGRQLNVDDSRVSTDKSSSSCRARAISPPTVSSPAITPLAARVSAPNQPFAQLQNATMIARPAKLRCVLQVRVEEVYHRCDCANGLLWIAAAHRWHVRPEGAMAVARAQKRYVIPNIAAPIVALPVSCELPTLPD